MIPALTTDNLILRAPKAADVDGMAAFYASEAARFVGGPMPRAKSWRYMCEVIGHWSMRGYGRWSVTAHDDDTALGLVGLHAPEDWPEPELGWMLWPGAEGRSIAFEAARAARNHAYQALGWTTVISMIDPANTRSITLAERLGARRDGDHTHGVYGTMGIWRHPAPSELAQ